MLNYKQEVGGYNMKNSLESNERKLPSEQYLHMNFYNNLKLSDILIDIKTYIIDELIKKKILIWY